VFRNTGYGPGGKYFDPPIHATMFHDGRFKLNVYHNLDVNSGRFDGELFDMQDDPFETQNLWNRPNQVDVKTALLQRMLNWTVESDVRHWGSRGGEKFRQSVMKEYDKERR
jgi:hypothetical protein